MTETEGPVYIHPWCRIVVNDDPEQTDIRATLVLEYKLDPDSFMILSRCPAFPALVGSGSNKKETQKDLTDVFNTYVESFIELNGFQKFEAHLLELGFQRCADIEVVKSGDGDQDQWEGTPPDLVRTRNPIAAVS